MKIRTQLREAIATSMDAGEFDVDSITPLVADLLKTQPQGSWGPYGFNATEVVDMMRAFAIAMANYDNFSDGAFYEVRARHRQMVVQYIRDQPALASHTTFGDWFADVNFEFLINNSCRDLLLGLGVLRLAEEYGRTLGPVPLNDWKRLPDELRFLPVK